MWVAAKALLSFVGSPAGQILLAVLAFLAWGGYQRIDATADCREDQLQAELEEAQRQNVIAAEEAAEARVRADQAQTELRRLKEIADEIANSPDNSCAISPADAERLRRIN